MFSLYYDEEIAKKVMKEEALEEAREKVRGERDAELIEQWLSEGKDINLIAKDLRLPLDKVISVRDSLQIA
jgi:hypothetical protein